MTINDSNSEVLTYVNIGILNKNIGTVSDHKGQFELTIPDSLLNDTLSFSHVGFEHIHIRILDLLEQNGIQIRLKMKDLLLDEISIHAKEPKEKKYGTRGHSPFLSVPAYINNDIYEIAFLVEPKKTPLQIQKLNLFVKYSSIDSCLFRINIYDNSSGFPGEKINTENILIRTKITQSDWTVVDLSQRNLVLDHDFFISVEFLPDFKNNEIFQISYGAKLIKGGKTYFRKSSLGKWTSFFGNVSFNIEVVN
jgi:hypothetical protein